MLIPSRYAPQLFALLMSLVMSFIVSAFVTWVNTGIVDGFAGRWMHAFTMAWPVAFICVLIFLNPVRAMVAKLTAR